MLEKLNRVNCLFDIYGSLLTPRQQEAMQLYFSDGLTLNEIALKFRISRQAVHDLLQRAIALLEKLESRLRGYKQFEYLQKKLTEADRLLSGERLGKREHECLKGIIRELLDFNKQ